MLGLGVSGVKLEGATTKLPRSGDEGVRGYGAGPEEPAPRVVMPGLTTTLHDRPVEPRYLR
jgi:hypothetical protein